MSYLDFDFPHTRFFESDLRELIKQVFIMNDLVTNFVSINAIKYADPIQWNITKSYEKNTVVIDGNSGVAYISVRPVPAGVALTREQYWTKVFDLSVFITKGAANFARSYEEQPTTTATMETNEGEWVVWDTTLFKALTNIRPGDRYVVDGNIKRMTVEDFYDVLKSIIDNETHEREAGDDALELALNEETEIRGEADSALHQEIVQESVDRENADNTLQDNIDAEAQTRENADRTLQDNIDAEAQARENADRTLQDNIDAEADLRVTGDLNLANIMGRLSDLSTTIKTNLVAAINEVNSQLSGLYDRADIRNYGGVADGSTDVTEAFSRCMSENKMVYMPNYNGLPYVLSAVNISSGQSVIGTEGTTINTSAALLFNVMGSNTEFKNLIINTPNYVFQIDSTYAPISFIHIENVYSYGANVFISDNGSAQNTYTNLYVNRCAARQHRGAGIILTKCFAFCLFEDVTIDYVGQVGTASAFNLYNNYGAHLVRCEAEGGYSDGSHSAHGGFNIDTCQAVWLERCMADTVDATGFNIRNSQYIYMNTCVSSLNGGHGIALIGTATNNILINNCFIGGRRGMSSAPAYANGIYNLANIVQINNCNIQNCTGYGYAGASNGNETVISNINILDCGNSFAQSSGGGLVTAMRSNINDVPGFGTMYHRLCFCYATLYDSPLGV